MRRRHHLLAIIAGCSLALSAMSSAAPAATPILLDTDIGTDVDDAYALALILASRELDLRAVTTVGTGAEDRAWMVGRFLTHLDRTKVPVAWGRGEQPRQKIDWQIQYRRHPAVVWNRTAKPVKQPAVELLYGKLKAEPGKLTIVAIGPLTNIARLLEKHPESKAWIKRIVLMGGALRVGYNGKPPLAAEWNIRADVKAAQRVFTSGVPLTVAPLDATASLKLGPDLRRRIALRCSPLTYQVHNLYQLWDKETPVLFDPLAVTLAFDERFCKMSDVHLTVDEKGFTRVGRGKPNARVATAVDGGKFLDWCVNRIVSAGEPVLPRPLKNRSSLVPRGGLPLRVHTFEDYDTDIEKRWWMTGKLETKDVPPGGRRACRSVLTQDYDDLMGQRKTNYSAVIFNPVPGPPMGGNTRLSFRYQLHGTDELRVQLYSLSKGYHRYLSLSGLPQDEWQIGTVEMTKMRRPDGSGGALAKDERIDDIQFYVDPRAEVLIDDVVLYEPAPDGEKRPYPKRLLFTGWFDTGKQGREWPGDFEIVLHKKPLTWDAAKSVPNKKLGRPWIRLYLRGERPLGETITRLRFRYRLSGATSMQIALVRGKTRHRNESQLKDLKQDEWAEATLTFKTPRSTGSLADHVADELRFVVPKGATLLIDDVLLYEPGETHP